MAFPGRLLAALVLIVGLAVGAQQKPEPKVVFEEAQEALVKGRYAEAERGFREVLQMNPDLEAAPANLGVVYIRTNRLDEAIEAFTKARRLAPRLTGIDLNLVLANYRQRNFPKAIPAFARALESSHDAFQPRFLLGMSYLMTDDSAHTVQTLEPLSAFGQTTRPVADRRLFNNNEIPASTSLTSAENLTVLSHNPRPEPLLARPVQDS